MDAEKIVQQREALNKKAAQKDDIVFMTLGRVIFEIFADGHEIISRSDLLAALEAEVRDNREGTIKYEKAKAVIYRLQTTKP